MLPRPFVLLAVAAGSTLVLFSGCTSDPVGATPSAASSSPAASSPATSSSTASGSPAPSASSTSSPSPSTPADPVRLDITIKDHQVSPNAEKIDVRKGQTVILEVTSDVDDEIHAHIGEGFELEVKAGEPATGRFVAGDTGSFEVESHHLEKIIAILVVR